MGTRIQPPCPGVPGPRSLRPWPVHSVLDSTLLLTSSSAHRTTAPNDVPDFQYYLTAQSIARE